MVDTFNTIGVLAWVDNVKNASNNGNEAWDLDCFTPPLPGQNVDLNTRFEIKVIPSYLKNEQGFFNNSNTQLFLNWLESGAIGIEEHINKKVFSFDITTDRKYLVSVG